MLLKQSTARSRVVFMVDSTDHVTGKTGLTLTITASKDGAAFGSITPTVTELVNGWYKLALTTGNTDTLGDLAIHITATGADPTDLADQVLVLLPGEAVTLQADQAVNVTKVNGTTQTARDLGLQLDATVSSRMATYTQPTGFLASTFPASVASPTNITAGTITTTTNLTNLPSIPANWLTAAGINAAALNGKGDWNTVAPDNTRPANFNSLAIGVDGKIDTGKINGTTVQGTGVSGDLWRG